MPVRQVFDPYLAGFYTCPIEISLMVSSSLEDIALSFYRAIAVFMIPQKSCLNPVKPEPSGSQRRVNSDTARRTRYITVL